MLISFSAEIKEKDETIEKSAAELEASNKSMVQLRRIGRKYKNESEESKKRIEELENDDSAKKLAEVTAEMEAKVKVIDEKEAELKSANGLLEEEKNKVKELEEQIGNKQKELVSHRCIVDIG